MCIHTQASPNEQGLLSTKQTTATDPLSMHTLLQLQLLLLELQVGLGAAQPTTTTGKLVGWRERDVTEAAEPRTAATTAATGRAGADGAAQHAPLWPLPPLCSRHCELINADSSQLAALSKGGAVVGGAQGREATCVCECDPESKRWMDTSSVCKLGCEKPRKQVLLGW